MLQLTRYPCSDYGSRLICLVPADLLLSFGDFVKKYGLDAAVPVISKYEEDVGNIMEQTTLHVAKLQSSPASKLSSVFGPGTSQLLVVTRARSNYTKAAAVIGASRIQYRNTVAAMKRAADPNKLHVLRSGDPLLSGAFT